jgi:hypothetical protein
MWSNLATLSYSSETATIIANEAKGTSECPLESTLSRIKVGLYFAENR